jgi:hypothetical protein
MASRRARQRPGVGWDAELTDDQRSASSGASSPGASSPGASSSGASSFEASEL